MNSFRKSIILLLFLFTISFSVSAQDLEIIPEVDGGSTTTVINDVNKVSSQGGSVRDNYSGVLSQNRSLEEKLASGIMDRDTILDYFAHFVKYLSELGIFIGACFVIYAGYVYATAIFKDGKVSDGKAAISNAILGVVIITFSYAIMKAIMAALL